MSQFVKHLTSVFAELGPISARRMFGGYGIYCGDLMFGLVADDVLYLKADDATKQQFADRGLAPFVFVKNGKAMQMSYYAAPEEVCDDAALAKAWGDLALGAAARAKPAGGKAKRKN